MEVKLVEVVMKPMCRVAVRSSRVGCLLLVCGLALPALGQPAAFTALDDDGFGFASPRAISADGSVVAGDFSTQFGQAQAGRWVFPGPSTTQIGLLSGQGTSVEILTRDGQTIYGRSTFTAFRWTSPGPIVADPNGTTTDITPDGAVRIVANKRKVGAAASENLGAPDTYDDGFLRSISASGTVILGTGERVESGGGYLTRGGQTFNEAALWSSTSGWQRLGFLPGDGYSQGLFISDDGSVQVGTSQSDGSGTPRTWRKQGAGPLTDLGTLPGFEGASVVPIDMSADGSVIVGEISSRLFVWTAGVGMEDLEAKLRAQGQDLDLWQLLSVDALSADGNYVVGQGVNPSGDVGSWIAPLSYSCTPPTGPVATEHAVVASLGAVVASEPGSPTVTSLSGGVFGNVPPSVGKDGKVLHVLTLSSGVIALFNGPGPAAVRLGDAAPGGGTFSSFSFGTQGGDEFLLNGSAGTASQARAGLWVSSAGVLAQLARQGVEVQPGGPVIESFIGQPAHNQQTGISAFIGLQPVNPDNTQFFNFFVGVPGNVQRYFTSAGTVAAFPPGTLFTTPTLLSAVNSAGQIAVSLTISYPGVPSSADECIQVRALGQTSSQVRVLEGDPAPGLEPGVRLGSVINADVSMNASGHLAFAHTLSTGESAVLADGPSGLVVVARDGMQAPGQAPGVTLSNFDVALINDNNTVLIRAIIAGPGIESSRSLWAGPVGGPLALLVRPGDAAPAQSFCRDIQSIDTPLMLNNADQVLLPVTMVASGGNVVRKGLYVHDPAQGLVLVAADGEEFSFGPGDQRRLLNVQGPSGSSASTSEGKAVALNDNGVVVFSATIEGGTASTLRARVAPPAPTPCLGDADGSGTVNFDDLTTVLANFGATTAPFGLGDADGSGVVNFDDLTTVLANFGSMCP